MGDVGDLQRLMVAERIGQRRRGRRSSATARLLKLELIPRELET